MFKKTALFLLCVITACGGWGRVIRSADGQLDDAVGMPLKTGFNGDNRDALKTLLNNPMGVAVDKKGNIYFSDTSNHRVRKLDLRTKEVTTVAGTGKPGFGNDGSSADFAQLNAPTGLAFDRNGNLFIADTGNHKVRWVEPVKKTIFTIAGTGEGGFSGEGDRKCTDSKFNHPTGLAMDKARRLYIADTDNQRIRRLEFNGMFDSKVQTVAGTGKRGYNGDGGSAWDTTLSFPGAMVITPFDALYFVDTGNGLVRRIQHVSTIETPSIYRGAVSQPQEDKRSFFEVLFGRNNKGSQSQAE